MWKPVPRQSARIARSGMAAVSALMPMLQVPACEVSVTLKAVPRVGAKAYIRSIRAPAR